jgi:hypothetical protein
VLECCFVANRCAYPAGPDPNLNEILGSLSRESEAN